MKVYIIKSEWYDSKQGYGYPNTGIEIEAIKTDKIEAIDVFNEIRKKDRQDSVSYNRTLIYEAEIEQDKEFKEIDITDSVDKGNISKAINSIRQKKQKNSYEKEIYIIKNDWFSDDQGEFPNSSTTIIDISFDREKAIEEFKEYMTKDNYWSYGYDITLITKARIGKNIDFKEEDLTEILKQESKKEELSGKMEASKDLDGKIGQAEELLSEYEKQDPEQEGKKAPEGEEPGNN